MKNFLKSAGTLVLTRVGTAAGASVAGATASLPSASSQAEIASAVLLLLGFLFDKVAERMAGR